MKTNLASIATAAALVTTIAHAAPILTTLLERRWVGATQDNLQPRAYGSSFLDELGDLGTVVTHARSPRVLLEQPKVEVLEAAQQLQHQEAQQPQRQEALPSARLSVSQADVDALTRSLKVETPAPSYHPGSSHLPGGDRPINPDAATGSGTSSGKPPVKRYRKPYVSWTREQKEEAIKLVYRSMLPRFHNDGLGKREWRRISRKWLKMKKKGVVHSFSIVDAADFKSFVKRETVLTHKRLTSPSARPPKGKETQGEQASEGDHTELS